MANNKTNERPWYLTTRALGIGFTVTGIAMWFVPVTHPIAEKFITAGLALIAGGQYASSTRKAYEPKVINKK